MPTIPTSSSPRNPDDPDIPQVPRPPDFEFNDESGKQKKRRRDEFGLSDLFDNPTITPEAAFNFDPLEEDSRGDALDAVADDLDELF